MTAKRTEFIGFRVSAEERRALEERASQLGLTLSSYIREAVLKTDPRGDEWRLLISPALGVSYLDFRRLARSARSPMDFLLQLSELSSHSISLTEDLVVVEARGLRYEAPIRETVMGTVLEMIQAYERALTEALS